MEENFKLCLFLWFIVLAKVQCSGKTDVQHELLATDQLVVNRLPQAMEKNVAAAGN